jgi:LacI family transcriptional regulator
MAIDLMATFREEGIEIGNHILIAGFDDIPLARYVTPQLTTVHSDISRLGSTAALMLLQILNGEKLDASDGRVIQPALAVRGSTAGMN